MDIKEKIHELSEEMIQNLGRLVAVDSQLGTPEEGKPFGEGPAKALEVGLKIADELGFQTVNLTTTVAMQRWAKEKRLSVLPDISISCRWEATGLTIPSC